MLKHGLTDAVVLRHLLTAGVDEVLGAVAVSQACGLSLAVAYASLRRLQRAGEALVSTFSQPDAGRGHERLQQWSAAARVGETVPGLYPGWMTTGERGPLPAVFTRRHCRPLGGEDDEDEDDV